MDKHTAFAEENDMFSYLMSAKTGDQVMREGAERGRQRDRDRARERVRVRASERKRGRAREREIERQSYAYPVYCVH